MYGNIFKPRKQIPFEEKGFFDLEARGINGRMVHFDRYRDNKCFLITNVASSWVTTDF